MKAIKDFFAFNKNKLIIFFVFPLFLAAVSYFLVDCPKEADGECKIPGPFSTGANVLGIALLPFLKVFGGKLVFLGWIFNIAYWYTLSCLVNFFFLRK